MYKICDQPIDNRTKLHKKWKSFNIFQLIGWCLNIYIEDPIHFYILQDIWYCRSIKWLAWEYGFQWSTQKVGFSKEGLVPLHRLLLLSFIQERNGLNCTLPSFPFERKAVMLVVHVCQLQDKESISSINTSTTVQTF